MSATGRSVYGSGGGGGDRRSKLVRERSRSSAAFASSTGRRLDYKKRSLRGSLILQGKTTSSDAAAGNDGGGVVSSGGMRGAGSGGVVVPRAFKTEANNTKEDDDESFIEEEQSPALFTSFCYKGVEVIFTAVQNNNGDGCELLVIHARTRVPFQTMIVNPFVDSSGDDSNNSGKKNKAINPQIVALTSHPTTGQIYAATSYGTIHSFSPIKADPSKHAYGKWRWVEGCVAFVREVFGYDALGVSLSASELGGDDGDEVKEGVVCFRRRRRQQNVASSAPSSAASPLANYPLKDGQPPLPSTNNNRGGREEYGVMICASLTEKRVLIVHKDQLSIYDFSTSASSDKGTISGDVRMPPPTVWSAYPKTNNRKARVREALLLWTHKMQGAIINYCSFSGDGCAIALVLRGEGVGVPYPFGVRTFVRDREDGTHSVAASGKAAGSATGVKTTMSNSSGGSEVVKPGGKPPRHRRTGSELKAMPVENPPLPKGGNNFDSVLENVFGGDNTTTHAADEPDSPSPRKRAAKGILYKPGPFLVHSAPVTRISFRGFGTTTSSSAHNSGWNETEEGNDLLLTSCSTDSSVRIFSQNSWRQLMHWASPPKSRADWVRGITAANLGDLDTSPMNTTSSKKKKVEGQMSPIPKDGADPSYYNQQQHHGQSPSMPPSSDNSVSSDASGGINRALLASHHHHVPTPSSFPSHSVPGTHAGAWIAELTFRNAFPALRLSRLSYMKTGGDDALPAHFESVAAILPPGSITEEVVLDDSEEGERRLEVEGIWPAWDPWEPDTTGSASSGSHGNDGDTSKRLLGPSAASTASVGNAQPPPMTGPRWLGDGAELGGSHIPPSELRITSSHLNGDCLVQIEMPLWGDKDFGAMEFGAPMRYVMSIPGSSSSPQLAELPCANLEFESGSRLCARTSLDRRSVDLCWRMHGAVNLEEDFATTAGEGPKRFKDLSLTPLPLCLPSLVLPGHHYKSADNLQSLLTFDKHSVSSLHWWADENFGGPPRLVTLTQGGTLIVYEMPPPWSALEPPMPSYDPFDSSESRGSSIASDFGAEKEGGLMLDDGFDEEAGGEHRWDYEVTIAPHPDFGIGLRLEAQAQGMPAIAGSFKKHPLSGGRLPAERSGAIALGDELISVNDVNLEGFRFEDAIATVRQIGFDSYGAPLQMRFRRCKGKKRGSAPSSIGSKGGRLSSSDKGTPESKGTNIIMGGAVGGSLATVEVGADAENQQEFGRIIAIVRDAVGSSHDESMMTSSPAMLLLPWNFGKGAIVSHKMYGGALVLWAVPDQRLIKAARLEVVLDIDPENARFYKIGSIAFDEQAGDSGSTIKSITFISSTENGWLVAVNDSSGNVSLLFVETFSTATTGSRGEITASFRHYPSIFNVHGNDAVRNKGTPKGSFVLRSFSVELFGCMSTSVEGYKEVTIWSALPQTTHSEKGSTDLAYSSSIVAIRDIVGLSDEYILDFRWVSSGFVDAFPWLVVFARSAAVVYRRPCSLLSWQPCAVLAYPSLSSAEASSPHDVYPHLISALRCAVLTNDEQSQMRSDWHPESILASICTEEEGTKTALKSYVKGVYSWLSQWMNADESMRPSWEGQGPLSGAPFRIVNDKTVSDDDDKEDDAVETSTNLMSALSVNPVSARPQSEEEVLLSKLQKALCPIDGTSQSENASSLLHNTPRSREFLMTMSVDKQTQKKEVESKQPLPAPLQSLSKDELICVWAIGEVLSQKPSFSSLDSYSQLCLFSVSLMRRLLDVKTASEQSTEFKPSGIMPSYVGGRPTFTKQMSSNRFEQEPVRFDTAASAAFLSALMSNTQSTLVVACRPKGEKYDWVMARAVGIPFWVRSKKTLVSIAEEIAQAIYKSTKSVMDCALYYVAMRNMKTLRAIAATDRSDSGTKFLKFIIDHDFSSERGRKAAEKNAYSLLRKRKYATAASFFLLAEPPMIKTALDVIKSQMKDITLAFMVARLMENAPKSSAMPDDALTIGGGFNLSSMGGGGGFAGGGPIGGTSLDLEEDGAKFSEWSPSLGPSARSVLQTKGTSPAVEDNCMESVKLLWLNRPNEAMLRLAHMPTNSVADASSINDVAVPSISGDASSVTNGKVLQKTNEVINFCSGPFLLKAMEPKKRVLWSSALLVSRAMGRCGIENSAMRILLQVADPSYVEPSDKDTRLKADRSKTSAMSSTVNAVPSSRAPTSILDSFDAPTQTHTDATSSIFDSFDMPPPKPKAPSQTQPEITSSIFDSFDAPSPKPKVVAPPPPSQADPMASSIFDSFDAPLPRPKAPTQQQQSDPMASSIFDSLYAAPPKPKPTIQQLQTADPMTSSIFDSFDGPTQKQATKSAAQPAAPKVLETKDADEIEEEQPFDLPEFPALWNEWREQLIQNVAARRLLREMARILSSFNGEPHYCNIETFTQHKHPLIPMGAAEVLHKACDSEGLLNSIHKSLYDLRTSFGVDENIIIAQALVLLSTNNHPRRIVLSVLLQCLLGRSDFAEDLVRDAASMQMNCSELLGFSNDMITDNKDSKYYISSQWARRDSANILWQLELCLWLHRGGAFDISSIALKETLLAVRVGLATASWGRCHQSLDTLIKAEPDCLLDFDAGKNLWRSMKIIVVNENTLDNVEGVSSGGWEFLVDCRRDEATEMLRDGKTGQFLIRPHAQDPGVFTLSFKTNLVPTETLPTTNYDEAGGTDAAQEQQDTPSPSKVIKRDDVVQHAIVRLSDSGFRCGSFGPFTALVKLLHAVSDSLPFNLRFSDPPVKGIISERGTQTSPNSFLFRKLALHSTAEFIHFHGPKSAEVSEVDDCLPKKGALRNTSCEEKDDDTVADVNRRYALFSQLLFLTEFRKQLCAVAAAHDDEADVGASSHGERKSDAAENIDDEYDGSISEGSLDVDEEEILGLAARMVRPLLNWCKAREIEIVDEIAPLISDIKHKSETLLSVAINASGDEFEVPSIESFGGDSMIRRMIQAGSGVDFRTLRVGEPGNSVIVVLFNKQDAIKWLVANETGNDETEALERLRVMELLRVIEPITSSDLSLPKGYAATHPSTSSQYRFVDPWEVEALESKAGETASAALGRGKYHTLSVGLIAAACEKIVRASGGLHLLGLWSTMKGGISLTKALCSAHPAWERDAGGDLQMKGGFLMEPSPYENSIRQHLYGNSLFRRLKLPQRFLALIQVELLDLKNVTSPSGTSSLTAYALLRLKRQGSSAPLNHKARSLDSACTQARKISKISGPNAPASWGSLVRFRFPLPEDVNCEGKSFDSDRESLFKVSFCVCWMMTP